MTHAERHKNVDEGFDVQHGPPNGSVKVVQLRPCGYKSNHRRYDTKGDGG
jgi:hypothetical protein